jgi:hypothetical protein
MISGATVELGDELAGRGHHDGVKSGRPVEDPSSEDIFGDLAMSPTWMRS